MKKHYDMKVSGVCSRMVSFDIEDGIVRNVVFTGGCRGNTTGVASLAEGMPAEEIVKRLRGIECRGSTSCPDQFSKAVERALKEEE